MSDLISRQDAIDAVKFGITYAKAFNKSTGEVKELFKEGNKALNEAAERLKELPSAQPDKDLIHLQKEQAYMQGYADGQKPQKGKWIPDENFGDDAYVCSFCQAIWNTEKIKNMEYCPSCGACMREEKNGE